ncbi:MAG: RNA polymerase-binding protein DksA [Candidatus Marinimicrobia bacterium]|nr:RNA polymerase-binding protein DksA [Candidatus Neomarinimicrobiota bacterium]RPG05167.1 MAG: RNA polymerase-binding protein DksA [Pelagibacteraceae bacterium TMED247]|tara:strand:- start:1810 stop:2229 length:420 start_codon:yes stop_codon:yes gene_type:complete
MTKKAVKKYIPSKKEKYMCTKHKKYFSERLRDWRKEIVRSNNENVVLNNLDDNVSSADIVDQASSQTEKTVELRASNRRRKLINKIDHALRKLKDGSYGFCEETGEPIGLQRLIARPIATLCIEAQERHEKKEKIYVEN